MLKIVANTYSTDAESMRTFLDEQEYKFNYGENISAAYYQDQYLENARQLIKEAQQQDVCVLCDDEIYFNAIRLAIKENNFTGAILYTFIDEYPGEYPIDSDGRLEKWPDCFHENIKILRQLL